MNAERAGPAASATATTPAGVPTSGDIWTAMLTPQAGGDRGGGTTGPSGYCAADVCGQNANRPAFGNLSPSCWPSE